MPKMRREPGAFRRSDHEFTTRVLWETRAFFNDCAAKGVSYEIQILVA